MGGSGQKVVKQTREKKAERRMSGGAANGSRTGRMIFFPRPNFAPSFFCQSTIQSSSPSPFYNVDLDTFF